MRRRHGLSPAALCLALLGCGAPHAAVDTGAPLGPDEVARVGGVHLSRATVAEVARAQGVAPSDALGRLLSDALLAQEAIAAGLDRTSDVSWASTSALARVVPQRILDEARSRGAPNDEELSTLTVVHALVQRSASLSDVRAGAIAEAIHRAVADVSSEADFKTRANAVPHPSAPLIVERLDAFDVEGRMANGARLEPSFVAAAFGLVRPGDTSAVVETPFGWHVIRLLDRSVPDRETLERLRSELAEPVFQMRGRAELQRVLSRLRRTVPVEVAAGAEALAASAARTL